MSTVTVREKHKKSDVPVRGKKRRSMSVDSDQVSVVPRQRKSKRVKNTVVRKKDPGFLSYKPRVPDVSYVDTVSPEFLQTLSSQERTRQSVIFELINTEQLYFRDLRILTDAFLRPIREKEVLTNDECTTLFGNLEILVTVSEKFMRDLEQLQQKDQIVEGVGNTILAHVDCLRPAFVEYCSKQSVVIEFLNGLEENNEPFREFLQSRAHKPIYRSLKLGSFLAAPFQRLCKYPLLLGEIRKATPAGHADSLALEVAHQKMKEILDETNAQATKIDEAFKLQEFRKKMDKKYTELLEQCELQLDEEVTVEADGAQFTTHMILLDQYLLYTKFKRDNIKVKRKIDLEVLQVCDDADERATEISLSISGEVCSFLFKTLDQKTKWKERLLSLQTMHLEALVRKKAIRLQRSKKPLQPQEIDPEDELGLLEHENQLLANQLHSIALSGGQVPSTNSAQYLPVGDKSKSVKKKTHATHMLSKVKDRLAIDEHNSGPGNTKTSLDLPRLEATPSVLDLFEKLNRQQRDYSLPQLVVVFQGPRYAGKTTIIRKLISICSKEHQFRCAYLHENNHLSVLNPFSDESKEVTPATIAPTLVQSSLMMGNIVESILQLEHVDFYYDVIFIDGEFRFESQMTAFLRALENMEITTLLCTVTAPASTLQARKQSANSKNKGKRTTDVPPSPYAYRPLPIPNAVQLNTVQPVRNLREE